MTIGKMPIDFDAFSKFVVSSGSRISKTFSEYDTNQDGYLEKDEVDAINDYGMTDDEFSSVDTDGDGKLNPAGKRCDHRRFFMTRGTENSIENDCIKSACDTMWSIVTAQIYPDKIYRGKYTRTKYTGQNIPDKRHPDKHTRTIYIRHYIQEKMYLDKINQTNVREKTYRVKYTRQNIPDKIYRKKYNLSIAEQLDVRMPETAICCFDGIYDRRKE